MKIIIELYKYPLSWNCKPETTNIVDMENKIAVKHLIEFLKNLTKEDLISIELKEETR